MRRLHGELCAVRDVQPALPAAPLPDTAQVQRARIAVVRRRADKRRNTHTIARVHADVGFVPIAGTNVHADNPASLHAPQLLCHRVAAGQPTCEKTLASSGPLRLRQHIQPLNRRQGPGARQVEGLWTRQRPLRTQRARNQDRAPRQ